MANDDVDIQRPSDVLNKLTHALSQVTRGDPMVALRNELDVRFGAVETRLNGIDRATVLQHDDMVRVPTLLQTAMEAQGKLIEEQLARLKAEIKADLATQRGDVLAFISETREKFVGVGNQFSQADKALVAAFLAQEKLAIATTDNNKEASKKMEDGFTKLNDAMTDKIETKTSNLDGAISEIKSMIVALQTRSMNLMENKGEQRNVRVDNREDNRNSMSVISIVISLAALATIIVIELVKH